MLPHTSEYMLPCKRTTDAHREEAKRPCQQLAVDVDMQTPEECMREALKSPSDETLSPCSRALRGHRSWSSNRQTQQLPAALTRAAKPSPGSSKLSSGPGGAVGTVGRRSPLAVMVDGIVGMTVC